MLSDGDVNLGVVPADVKFTRLVAVETEVFAVNVMGRFLNEIDGVPVISAVPSAELQVNESPKSSRLVIPNLVMSDAEMLYEISIGFVPVAEILLPLYDCPVVARVNVAVSLGATPLTLKFTM